MRACLVLLPSCLAIAACGAPPVRPATWDAPVPANERRASLTVRLDLESAADCEERFDLRAYEDRGVEMITWSEGPRGCTGLKATVRYLPGRIGRDALLERVRRLAKKVEVIEG